MSRNFCGDPLYLWATTSRRQAVARQLQVDCIPLLFSKPPTSADPHYTQAVIAQANQQPALKGNMFTQFTASTPQFEIDFDRDRLEALNVDFQQAVNTLGAAIGTMSMRTWRW